MSKSSEVHAMRSICLLQLSDSRLQNYGWYELGDVGQLGEEGDIYIK